MCMFNIDVQVVHGTYNAERAATSGNGEEWARAGDQYSKVTMHK